MYSIGLMSGTSMDGIDAALLETDGELLITELGHIALPYDPNFKILLKAAEFAVKQTKGNLTEANEFYPASISIYLTKILKFPTTALLDKIRELNVYLYGNHANEQTINFTDVIEHSTELHIEAVKLLLTKTKLAANKVDVIGYHGQTLLHSPKTSISVNIGNAQTLADAIGILVINDFRRRDITLGGQGAPFAPLYHRALAIRDNKIPLAVVNCGGIANMTLIAGANENDVIGFDTGPGNGLIDRYIQQRTHSKEFMDKDGRYGKAGTVNIKALTLLNEQAITPPDFLTRKPPKSLDINDLQLTTDILTTLNQLSLEDACATLEAFTANTIVDSLTLISFKPTYWVLAGGGWNNPVILEKLTLQLREKINQHVKIETADETGWNSQAMEAQIFAYFAVRSLKNLPLSLPTTTGVSVATSGGHAYIPSNQRLTTITKNLLQKNPAVLKGYL